MFNAKDVISGDISSLEKERLNKVYTYVRDNATHEFGVDKEVISNIIGLKGERVGRDYISALKKRKAVISHNGYKGFRLAKNELDIQDNERTMFEVMSRCEEMLYGVLQNLEFERKYNIKFEKIEKAINSFLYEMEQPKIAEMVIR